jgi:hypothetical protein
LVVVVSICHAQQKKVPDTLVYTLPSGEAHSAFEEIVCLGEANRVLMLVLSAKTRDAVGKP